MGPGKLRLQRRQHRLGGSAAFDANNPAWTSGLLRGVMACNDQTMDLAGIRDGTSSTIMAGEVRAGVNNTDLRGVWAMGVAGASILAGYGSVSETGTICGGTADANGPNACGSGGESDDIFGFQDTAGDAALDCMDVVSATSSSGSGGVATVRSLHPNGANVVFADDSVHFISNSVETSGLRGALDNNLPVWDRLICSSDRHAVDASDLLVRRSQWSTWAPGASADSGSRATGDGTPRPLRGGRK